MLGSPTRGNQETAEHGGLLQVLLSIAPEQPKVAERSPQGPSDVCKASAHSSLVRCNLEECRTYCPATAGRGVLVEWPIDDLSNGSDVR
jgi:hypothetical protein